MCQAEGLETIKLGELPRAPKLTNQQVQHGFGSNSKSPQGRRVTGQGLGRLYTKTYRHRHRRRYKLDLGIAKSEET